MNVEEAWDLGQYFASKYQPTSLILQATVARESLLLFWTMELSGTILILKIIMLRLLVMTSMPMMMTPFPGDI